MKNNLLASINMAAIFLPALILILTFRGFFRAFVAKVMGDDTAYNDGFLSLNPVAHIDLFGLLLIVFVLFVIGGLVPGGFSQTLLLLVLIFMGVRWSYDVPVNENNFKNVRLSMIFVSLAGFLGNCFLAFLLLYVRKYFPFGSLPIHAVDPIDAILVTTIDLSLFFGVFNLIPIYPFDGAVLLSYLLPTSVYNTLQMLQDYAIYILLILFLFGDVFFRGIGFIAFIIKLFLIHLVF